MQDEASSSDEQLTERRIAWLILVFGALSGSVAAAMHHGRFAAGLLIGAGLSWLNFRWLQHGLDAMVAQATAQPGEQKPKRFPGLYGFGSRFAMACSASVSMLILFVLEYPL